MSAEKPQDLHALRRRVMARFVATGDEPADLQYGDLTEAQFIDARAAAQNRWAVRTLRQAELERPDRDKLYSYANAIRALEMPLFVGEEAKAIGHLVAVKRDKFVAWLESKAEAL